MLILAFDTATDVATSALVDDGEVLGERISRAVTLLEDVDALLRQAGARTGNLDGLAVGIGPGSFTGVRIGLATARGLSFGLDLPVAGVSTLAALAAGAPGATPVIDARRREVFVLRGEARVMLPTELRPAAGDVLVGSGAVRYREVFEALGAVVPPENDDRHVPRAKYHARLAENFTSADNVEPLYLRAPDADRTRA